MRSDGRKVDMEEEMKEVYYSLEIFQGGTF